MRTLRESLAYYFRYKGWFGKLMPLTLVTLAYAFTQFLTPLFTYLDSDGLSIGEAYTNSALSNGTSEVGLFSILGALMLLLVVLAYIVVLGLYSYENTKAALDKREPKSILDVSMSENLKRLGRLAGSVLIIAIITTIILLPIICISLLFYGFVFVIAGSADSDTSVVLAVLLICPLAIALFVLYLAWYLIFAAPSLIRVIDEDSVSASAEIMDNLKFGWRNKSIFARLLILLVFSAIVGFFLGLFNGFFAAIFDELDLQVAFIPFYLVYMLVMTGFTVYLGAIVQSKFQADIYNRAKANSPISNE